MAADELVRFTCPACEDVEWDVWGELVEHYGDAMPLELGGMAFRLRSGSVLVIEGGFARAQCPECGVVGCEVP